MRMKILTSYSRERRVNFNAERFGSITLYSEKENDKILEEG